MMKQMNEEWKSWWVSSPYLYPNLYLILFVFRYRQGMRLRRTGSICTTSSSVRFRGCRRQPEKPTIGWVKVNPQLSHTEQSMHLYVPKTANATTTSGPQCGSHVTASGKTGGHDVVHP